MTETAAASRVHPALAIAADIKLAHSVFALPFALLGAGLALDHFYRHGGTLSGGQIVALGVLIVVCMVAARTWAMTMNRLLDAKVDARNPRTSGRAVPSGRVSSRQMAMASVGSAAVLIAAAAAFWPLLDNPWPLAFSPVVLVILGVYPLAKRVTWLCHGVLGLSLGLSPVAAALAVSPSVLAEGEVWWLGLGVLAWVAGFDILYALQDVEVDRRDALHSVPATLGVPTALWISRGLHAIAIAGFLLAGYFAESLGPIFGIAVAVAGAMLVAEHLLTRAGRTQALGLAFGTLNGLIAVLLGGAGMVDLVVG